MTPCWVQSRSLRLGTMPRPRGWDWLADDIKFLKQTGVDVIVSALTPAESEELGLSQESALCCQNEIDFVSFPIEDRSVPASVAEFDALLSRLHEHASRGRSVAVHCRMGIGRASLIAAGLLTRHGLSAAEAFQAVEQARGMNVPDTTEQRVWIERFAMRFENPSQM